jgi:hypothetical protein
MRWLVGVVAAVIVLLLIYFGSAASSLAKLAAAVRAGDGAAVGRLKVIKPVLFAIRVSNTSGPDGYAAIDLHYEGRLETRRHRIAEADRSRPRRKPAGQVKLGTDRFQICAKGEWTEWSQKTRPGRQRA